MGPVKLPIFRGFSSLASSLVRADVDAFKAHPLARRGGISGYRGASHPPVLPN